MVRVTLEAPEAARVIGNAVAFLPAASRIKHVLLDFRQDVLIASGTDGYAAGRDTAPLTSADEVPSEGIPVCVLASDVKELDRFARAAKKGVLAVQVDPGGTLSVSSDQSTEALVVPWEALDDVLGTYEQVDEVLTLAGARPPSWPGALMLDPALWSRFAKVKSDQTSRMADVSASDDRTPILIKIGPTFRGLIMPIRRNVQTEALGEDGQW